MFSAQSCLCDVKMLDFGHAAAAAQGVCTGSCYDSAGECLPNKRCVMKVMQFTQFMQFMQVTQVDLTKGIAE
jgi:hypothetical protein